jgi:hypothetical protein
MPALLARIVLLGVIVPLNIPIFRWAWRVCFGTMDEFETCIKYVMEFQLVSLYKFEFHHNAYATFKVAVFLLFTIGVVVLEFVGMLLVFTALRDIWGSMKN